MKKRIYYINAIRSMGLQAIINAKQGHPGMTISASPINYTVYINHINLSKSHPDWINRDRFVLSAGHGSMSLYPILHLARLIDLQSIKDFRQKISGLPGHPENISSPFIDASTGPLGQGISNGVGMAITEAHLRHKYSKLKGLIDHYTFVVVGDGDLQEGISYEAMSLAGKLKLSKLIVLHDSNNYQLETSVAFVNSENLKMRLESMGWKYISCKNEYNAIDRAIKMAKNQDEKPVFIEIKTIIGEGLEQENSANAHGFNLSQKDLDLFNANLNCNFDNWIFESDIYNHFYKNITIRGEDKYNKWNDLLKSYEKQYPQLTKEFLEQITHTKLDLSNVLDVNQLPKNKATRVIAGQILSFIEQNKTSCDKLFVLSPDVGKSTNVVLKQKAFNEDKSGNMLYTGIREFAMAGIMNGISLHKGLIPIGSSFLAFLDYLKPALRLSAISEISPIYVFTHDSILVGSDGPTHQPIEQITTLRSIPNSYCFRPCDETETYAAFKFALSQKTHAPISIVLSRQDLVSQNETSIEKTIEFGGYKIFSTGSNPNLTIVASGSEVELGIQTAKFLDETYKINCEVFSVPNLNKFIESIQITNKIKTHNLVSIEASNDTLWYKLANLIKAKNYCNIEINQFGYSIDGQLNYEYLGFNVYSVARKIIKSIYFDHEKWEKQIDTLDQENMKKLKVQ